MNRVLRAKQRMKLWKLGPAPVVPPPALVGPHPVRQNRRRGRVWGTNPAFQIAPIHAQGSREPTIWGRYLCAPS